MAETQDRSDALEAWLHDPVTEKLRRNAERNAESAQHLLLDIALVSEDAKVRAAAVALQGLQQSVRIFAEGVEP